MADFSDAYNPLNQSENQFNSMGIVHKSDNDCHNIANVTNFGQGKNGKALNQILKAHNRIAQNLADDSREEIDKNNDAEPEELLKKEPDDMNKTLDDIFTLQMFGRRDPKEKIVPFESKNAKCAKCV